MTNPDQFLDLEGEIKSLNECEKTYRTAMSIRPYSHDQVATTFSTWCQKYRAAIYRFNAVESLEMIDKLHAPSGDLKKELQSRIFHLDASESMALRMGL